MFSFLKTYFGGKNSPRSSRSSRPSFRPSLETLEERAVPTAFYWLGNYTAPGYSWQAGSQRVTFFAEEVQGSFTWANAQQAWSNGAALSLNSHGTLASTAEVADRTTSQHFLLIGWENLNTHTGGWVAAKYDTTWGQLVTTGPWWDEQTTTVWHSTMDWMSNDGQGQQNVQGWLTMNYTTNGYHVGLSLAPNSNGDLDAYFTPPN